MSEISEYDDKDILKEVSKHDENWSVMTFSNKWNRNYILNQWGRDIEMTNLIRRMWKSYVEWKNMRSEK